MEEKKSNLNVTMTWGLVVGLALIILSLVLYIMNIYKAPTWVGILNYALIIGGIVMAQLKYRNNILDGYITYGKAVGTGVLVSLFASIIYAFYFIILTKFIDTGYMDKVLETVEQAYAEQSLSEDQIAAALEMSKKMMTPIMMALSTVFGFVFMGTLFSLITSIFIKKEAPLFGSESKEGETLSE